jgi:NADPH:quinone reductase
VNFPDIRERLGVYNKAETRVGGVQLGQVGGLAVAGTVVATGPQTSVQVGRRVVALIRSGLPSSPYPSGGSVNELTNVEYTVR